MNNSFNNNNALKSLNKDIINTNINNENILDDDFIISNNETIISKKSIKNNENKSFSKTEIINDNNLIIDEIPFYEKEKNNESNNIFKETKAESENIISEKSSFKEHTLKESLIYNYEGEILNNKKEGIGKIVYNNKIGFISFFEKNKIKGPIIITDNLGNSFQGYINDYSEFEGYFNLKLNFTKNIINNKQKYENNIILNNKTDDEIIKIFSNFINIINTYLNLSTIKYNYINIESEIQAKKEIKYGRIKYKNNSKYIGEIKQNMKHGIGIFIWEDDSRYEGEFVENRMEGWGLIYFSDNKIFQGQVLNGVPNGYGEFIWDNNNIYVGNYVKGQKEGFGIYIMNGIQKTGNKNDLISYFGFWKNGKQDGYGIVIKNKKIKRYDYDIFSGKIHSIINNKYEKIFFSDFKTLKNIVKTILNF